MRAMLVKYHLNYVLQLQYIIQGVKMKEEKEVIVAASESAVPRVPISLRLPASVVESIESHAVMQGLSKTDSFLYFLQKGIEAENVSRQLEDIRSELGALRKAVERTPNDRVQKIREVSDAIAQSASKYPAIKRAYIFGSFARGDFDEQSDIDVRIERDSKTRFNLRDLDRFAKAVERATGREVDVVSAREISDSNLAAEIEKDKVLVYERETR